VTASRLQRLRRLSAQEVRWRVRSGVHTTAERARARFATPRWNREDLWRVLDQRTLAAISHRLLRRRDWLAVHDALACVVNRRQTRFALDPRTAALLRERVRARWPDARADAAGRAEQILAGVYDLLGYRDVAVMGGDGRIDWHADAVHGRRAPRVFYADVPYLDAAIGDHKVIWELNRHQHWLRLGRAALLTGDARYSREICMQLQGWLAANPPLTGINWASMLEIAFRTISWTWAAHCLLGIGLSAGATANRQPPTADDEYGPGEGNAPWLVDMLIGLDCQLTHVERHLSYYFSPNTHLTGEALALYVVGTAFPELAASARWVQTGRRILLDEIERQILNDGGHVERSTHYQRYTLDFYLLAARTARVAGDEKPAERFEEAASRLAGFTRTMADDSGQLPVIGDDDGGMLWPLTGRACADVRDSLAVAAVLLERHELAPWGTTEEVFWLLGPDAAALPPAARSVQTTRSLLLRDTGYFVARAGDGSHAVLDGGAHGYLNGGHAHADALSLTLTVDGQPLFIDPGTSTYTMDTSLRDRMRSSQSHNTVTLDGRSQSVPAGPFHWRSSVDARITASRSNPSFDWVEATHDGYAPARHRRTIVRSSDAGWLIVDAIGGEGRHHAAAHWHFDPAWHVTSDDGRFRCMRAGAGTVWLLSTGGETALFRGDAATGLGWYAPVYGLLIPTSTMRIAANVELPFSLVTWVGPASLFHSPYVRTAPAAGTADAATVVEILDGSRYALFMVRPAGASAPGTACLAGDCETDAVLLHYLEEDGQLRSLSLVGGMHCITTRDGWPSVAADMPIRDLHIAVKGNAIDLFSFEPPRQLTLHGTGRFTTVRLNGGDLPLSSKAMPDTLLIRDSDWPVFSIGKADGSAAANSGAAFARE
jgi:hypothetical protein